MPGLFKPSLKQDKADADDIIPPRITFTLPHPAGRIEFERERTEESITHHRLLLTSPVDVFADQPVNALRLDIGKAMAHCCEDKVISVDVWSMVKEVLEN